MRPTARAEPAPCWCGLIPALKRWSRRVRIVRGGSIATIALDLAFPPPDGAGQKTTKNDDKPTARPPFSPDLPGAGRNGQPTLPAALPNRWGDRRRKDPLWKVDMVAAPPRRTERCRRSGAVQATRPSRSRAGVRAVCPSDSAGDGIRSTAAHLQGPGNAGEGRARGDDLGLPF